MAALPHLPEGKWADLPEDLRTQLLGIYQQGYDGLMEELQRAKDEVCFRRPARPASLAKNDISG